MPARILVIDDTPVNLKLAADLLESEGYTVDRAEDADSALIALAQGPPDLILMDIALPGMDGLALTRRIKQDELLRRIPVIAMTAFAMKGDDVKALQAGCDGYITKPIDTRSFPDTIAAYLRAAAAR